MPLTVAPVLAGLALGGITNVAAAGPSPCGGGTLTTSGPTSTCTYTPVGGGTDTFTVPKGVTSISVDALGAQGGAGTNGTLGGLGGEAKSTITVTFPEVIQVNVGGAGSVGGVGGSGGGGPGGLGGGGGNGGRGGGASDIRTGAFGPTDRVVVAGGGGGAGGGVVAGQGGGGGGATGANGGNSAVTTTGGVGGGPGGADGAGGSGPGPGGPGFNNSNGGLGGQSDTNGGNGGGGGGGYGGGGGGAAGNFADPGAGGGGGGGLGTALTVGVKSGDGMVTITYTTPSSVNTKKRIIAGGQFHTLAVKSDGTVWTWGYNRAGQLGDGTTTQRTRPVKVTGLTGKTIVSVAGGGGPQSGAAGGHSMALDSTGHVWAWGANDSGELGQGASDGSAHSTPVEVKAGLQGGTFLGDSSPIVAIAGGRYHDLAVSADGKVWAWGAGDSGQLGDGASVQRNTPVKVDQTTMVNPVVDVAAGEEHSLAIDSMGKVWAWGQNADGELGDGTNTSRSTPVLVTIPGSRSAVYVAGAATHSLAVMSDGTAWAWGDNSRGQLARCGGGTTASLVPVQMCTSTGPITNVIAAAAGEDHSVLLRKAGEGPGEVWAAGHNAYGELGDGTTRQRNTLVQAKTSSGMTNATAIATGQDHSIAVSDGNVYTFGFNQTSSMTPSGGGQLGDGTTTNRSTPVKVLAL